MKHFHQEKDDLSMYKTRYNSGLKTEPCKQGLCRSMATSFYLEERGEGVSVEEGETPLVPPVVMHLHTANTKMIFTRCQTAAPGTGMD